MSLSNLSWASLAVQVVNRRVTGSCEVSFVGTGVVVITFSTVLPSDIWVTTTVRTTSLGVQAVKIRLNTISRAKTCKSFFIWGSPRESDEVLVTRGYVQQAYRR